MIRDGIFEVDNTTVSNIINISKMQSALQERQFCEAWELACDAADFFSAMLKEGYNVYEVCSMLEGSVKLRRYGWVRRRRSRIL